MDLPLTSEVLERCWHSITLITPTSLVSHRIELIEEGTPYRCVSVCEEDPLCKGWTYTFSESHLSECALYSVPLSMDDIFVNNVFNSRPVTPDEELLLASWEVSCDPGPTLSSDEEYIFDTIARFMPFEELMSLDVPHEQLAPLLESLSLLIADFLRTLTTETPTTDSPPTTSTTGIHLPSTLPSSTMDTVTSVATSPPVPEFDIRPGVSVDHLKMAPLVTLKTDTPEECEASCLSVIESNRPCVSFAWTEESPVSSSRECRLYGSCPTKSSFRGIYIHIDANPAFSLYGIPLTRRLRGTSSSDPTLPGRSPFHSDSHNVELPRYLMGPILKIKRGENKGDELNPIGAALEEELPYLKDYREYGSVVMTGMDLHACSWPERIPYHLYKDSVEAYVWITVGICGAVLFFGVTGMIVWLRRRRRKPRGDDSENHKKAHHLSVDSTPINRNIPASPYASPFTFGRRL